jgi:hypothetical protein
MGAKWIVSWQFDDGGIFVFEQVSVTLNGPAGCVICPTDRFAPPVFHISMCLSADFPKTVIPKSVGTAGVGTKPMFGVPEVLLLSPPPPPHPVITMAEKMMASDIKKYRPSACVFRAIMWEPRFLGFHMYNSAIFGPLEVHYFYKENWRFLFMLKRYFIYMRNLQIYYRQFFSFSEMRKEGKVCCDQSPPIG